MMKVDIRALQGIPEIRPGDGLSGLILSALKFEQIELLDSDILVIAHKVVSKSEGRIVELARVTPSPEAEKMAAAVKKDPRKVELILRESAEVLRVRKPLDDNSDGVIITRDKNGFVSANAAIDESNTGEEGTVILLPGDSDSSARQLRKEIGELTGRNPGIIISDTFGRPWRLGQVNVAIGLAGVPALTDLTQNSDAWGQALKVTKPAIADEIAAASGLVMMKDAKTPVIHFRGIDWQPENSRINHLIRVPTEDLFK